MEKPISKQKSQSIEHKSASTRDARIILILLAILYSIFTATAFIKSTYFWGINFLYYLPLWQKILFIGIGGLVFIPNVNDIIFKIYQRISDLYEFIQQRTQKIFPRIIYLLVLSVCFAGLFYTFRVVSLYHDIVRGIYYLEQDISSIEYYKSLAQMQNKPLLLLYIDFIRYLFRTLLNLSSYWSLVIVSIFFGVLFIIIVDVLLKKLELDPFQYFFVFVLIFTQALTYYYFGYVNIYAPIPIIIFLYLLASVMYFKNSTSIYFPLIMGALVIFTHFGTFFLLPSVIFLLINRYREHVPFLYDLFVFKLFKRSFLFFLSFIILFYIIGASDF